MNRSVTAYSEFAENVAQQLGGVINGAPYICPVAKRPAQLVTVIGRKKSLKPTAAFKHCKSQGWLKSWALA